MSSPQPRVLLITGATGHQGSAVISALLAHPTISPFKIIAVTRNRDSAAAIALSRLSSSITLLSGDLDNPEALFTAATPVWGVFSMQIPSQPSREETQGKALIDAALAHGVSHFVYASVDRHGVDSDNNPTNVPHFASKHHIEAYLRSQCVSFHASKGDTHTMMTWTILRPVCFFENLAPGMIGKGFAAMWRSMTPSSKMQFIACKDIGRYTARVFAKPEAYNGLALSLAADELSYKEASMIYLRENGRALPTSPRVLGWMLNWMLTDIGLMFRWFQEVGFGADIDWLRSEDKEVLDFRAWLREGKVGK